MTTDLDRLARTCGVVRHYHAIDGTPMAAPDEAIVKLLGALGVDAATPRAVAAALTTRRPLPVGEMRAPDDASSYLPDFLAAGGTGAWGVTCQLYGLNSQRNWGIGDFADLAAFGETMAGFGADFVGVNPLHALFPAEPGRASPFFPSDRRYLNVLYIAVDETPGYDPARDRDHAAVEAARAPRIIDYPAVARLKLSALRKIFDRTPGVVGDPDLRAFAEAGGEGLRRHALFQALSLVMAERGCGAGWLSWPEEHQDPRSAEVAAFAEAHAADIAFHVWLQFVADRQLGEADRRVRAAGMRIGIYLDLAVGTAPDGSSTWSDRSLSVVGAEIGAPPDMFNVEGQKWGLAPLSPAEIIARGFAPMGNAFGAVLRHAGALRIDHAMGLYRLFWIPAGHPAAEGAYVLYPMTETIRILAGLSREHRTVVIGEDLGVVPDGFRREMRRARMLGYRVFYFERNDGGFVPAHDWPWGALACVGSHDTPTLAGWWTGSDIDAREAIGFFDEAQADEARSMRNRERTEAVRLLGLPQEADRPEAFSADIALSVHRHVAATPSALFAAQIEDLLGMVDQANMPGTIDEHPNWRRRLPAPISELAAHEGLRAILAAVAALRPRR